jgi:hypothetical protein
MKKIVRGDKDMINEVKADYDLCINHPAEFQRKLDGISDNLGLEGTDRLLSDCTPAYVVGRLDAPYVMFALNPGYDANNMVGQIEGRKGWEEYQQLHREFYKRKYCPNSRFYKTNGRLLCGLTGLKDDWECFDANLLTLELIPYASKTMNGLAFSEWVSPSNRYEKKHTAIGKEYLNTRFLNMLEITQASKRKLLIFNGKIFHTLLTLNKYIDNAEKVNIIKNFDIYLFKIDNNIPCVLFPKFLTSGHFEGLTNDHLYTTIPNLIRQRYGEIETC